MNAEIVAYKRLILKLRNTFESQRESILGLVEEEIVRVGGAKVVQVGSNWVRTVVKHAPLYITKL